MRTIGAILALALTTAGCSLNRLSGPPMPTGLTPVSAEQVRGWAAESAIDSGKMVRIRWSFLEEGATAKGRGTAWLVPPDSLRFDFRGPLGTGAGAAVVVGDQEQWSEPEEEFRKLVPSFPLLWAILGSARPPELSGSAPRSTNWSPMFAAPTGASAGSTPGSTPGATW
jgi:hypothetical protein